jgi:hypothetical protein
VPPLLADPPADRAGADLARLARQLKQARLLAEAGLVEEASAEAAILAEEPGVSAEYLAQAGDLEASLGRADRAADLFRRAVERAGAEAPADWWVIWTNQLARLATQARGVGPFLAHRREAEQVLRAALAQLPGEVTGPALFTYRLVEILLQVDDNPALARLAAELTAKGGPVLPPRELALVAGLLRDNLPPGPINGWLAAAWRADPDQPDLLRGMARAALGDTAALARLWPQLLATEHERGDDQDLAALVGMAAHELGEWTIALNRLTAEGERRAAFDVWRRAGEAALHLGRDADAEAAFGRTAPRLAASALGPLAEALADIRAAVNRLYTFDDPVDHRVLAATLALSRSRLVDRLAGPHGWTPAMLFEAEEALDLVRRAPFRVLGETPARTGYIAAFDARYGTLDLEAFAIVNHALLEHEGALLEHAADALLAGAPPGAFHILRYLPTRLADILLEMDRPAAARARLKAIRDQGLASERVEQALERCDLHEGRVAAAAARWRAATPDRPAGSAHRTEYAAGWRRREGLEAAARWADPGLSGMVERARQDGGVDRLTHKTMPFNLDVTVVRDLEMRAAELAIGPRGTLLRPSDWHVRPGDYPQEYGLSLNAAAKAAVLPVAPAQVVDKPVLVLAGADPLSRPNYFHWMTHQLTRAVWAAAEGWLDRRRLLVPAESRAWMFEALRLAGIGEDRWLLQPPGRTLRLRDAWLVSAFEYPGAALLRATRERLWRGAAASRSAPPTRLVFLDRPRGARRGVFEARRLLAQVRAAGFEVIDTGELTVADQVALLADARGVAGFDGAAMTNLMFAREGTRILGFAYEGTLWPDFAGIAVALGQAYRHLPGVIPPSCQSMRWLDHAPVRYALALLDAQLGWARGDDAPRR